MKTQTPHEQFCLDAATHFSACRGRGIQRTRAEFQSMEAAIEYADRFGDGRTMIYAITDLGNNAHICNA